MATITKYDKNFAQTEITSEGKKRFAIPSAPFCLYGGKYDEKVGFLRMDYDAASKVSEGVRYLATNDAGLRLNFTTDSRTIKLLVEYGDYGHMNHMARTGSSGFTLCSRDGGVKRLCAVLCPDWNGQEKCVVARNLDGKEHDYVLHFPLYSSVKSLAIELDGEAVVKEGQGYRKDIKPILYYGSSITQGGCASRADNAYQNMICDRTNVDYINLGFSGSGKAEDEMTDYLSCIDCSIFVCDYDWNAPTPEYLQATHERLYRRYRAKKKDTPIVFVSRPDVYRGIGDGETRAEIIKATYEKAKKEGDNAVWFVDGRDFFPTDVRERCLVDGCHPNDLGFYFMSQKIGAVIEEILQTLKN